MENNMIENLDRVREVIATAFELPIEKVDRESSSQTIEQWDSVAHINLVMALEEKFGTTFTMEEIAEMHDVVTICKVIERKNSPC
jgi:acyl carrier protein